MYTVCFSEYTVRRRHNNDDRLLPPPHFIFFHTFYCTNTKLFSSCRSFIRRNHIFIGNRFQMGDCTRVNGWLWLCSSTYSGHGYRSWRRRQRGRTRNAFFNLINNSKHAPDSCSFYGKEIKLAVCVPRSQPPLSSLPTLQTYATVPYDPLFRGTIPPSVRYVYTVSWNAGVPFTVN